MRLFLYAFLFSPSQTRDTLHFSEDEDIVIVRSLDFASEYIDDCPWLRVAPETAKGVRGQPNGSNKKDMVCDKYIFYCCLHPASIFRTFLIKPLNGNYMYKITFSPLAVTLICIFFSKETSVSICGEKMWVQPDFREGANDSTTLPREERQRENHREQGEHCCTQQRGWPICTPTSAHSSVQ